MKATEEKNRIFKLSTVIISQKILLLINNLWGLCHIQSKKMISVLKAYTMNLFSSFYQFTKQSLFSAPNILSLGDTDISKMLLQPERHYTGIICQLSLRLLGSWNRQVISLKHNRMTQKRELILHLSYKPLKPSCSYGPCSVKWRSPNVSILPLPWGLSIPGAKRLPTCFLSTSLTKPWKCYTKIQSPHATLQCSCI